MNKLNIKLILLFTCCIFFTGCKTKTDQTKKAVSDSNTIAEPGPQPVINTEAISSGDIIVPEIINKEISPDRKIIEVYPGNLNLDNMDDYIVVTGKKTINPEVPEDQLRVVMLFLTREDSSLFLFAQNQNIIDCYTCGGGMGDPFTGVTINNGYFSIEQSGLNQFPERWVKVITFKFRKEQQNFYFHQYGHEVYRTDNDEKTSSEIIKSRDVQEILFADYNMNERLIKNNTGN
jgi:hypothetical protein